MLKKECPSYAIEINNKASKCPVCCNEFPVTNKAFIFVAVIILLIMIIYMVF